MLEGRGTIPPMGHVLMCIKHPSECEVANAPPVDPAQMPAFSKVVLLKTGIPTTTKGLRTPSLKPVTLTGRRWAQLISVNARVNAEIRPVADLAATGKRDAWLVSGRMGDCEDFAIRKRQALIRLGWPSHSTLITIAGHPVYGQHAVLIVRTNKGDFVLDNLSSAIRGWHEVSYNWVKRQSKHDPRKWVRLVDGSRLIASTEQGNYLDKVDAPLTRSKAGQALAKSQKKYPAKSVSPVRHGVKKLPPQRLAMLGYSAKRHALDRGVAAVWTGKSRKPRGRGQNVRKHRSTNPTRAVRPARGDWFRH